MREWAASLIASDEPHMVKLVGLVLAHYGASGRAIGPGHERLAADVSASPATVKRAVAVLKAHGWIVGISPCRKGHVGGLCTEYELVPR